MNSSLTAPVPAAAVSPAVAARPSYAALTNWRRYQDHFPPAMRVDASSTPTEEWWSWRGLEVHLDRLAVPDAKLKVIVLHGAGAYGRVMAPAAVLAQRHGFETVTPDLPGYGLTHVPRAQMTYQLWIDCVCDLIEAERKRDGRPLALFGVSLGGMLAYQVATRSPHVVGLAATTLADPSEAEAHAKLGRNAFLGVVGLGLLDFAAPLLDGLPMPMSQVTRMHAISNKPELSALCSEDRLGGGNWVPARFLRTLMTTPPPIQPEDFNRCPVLLAHPGEDRMTDISLSRRFFDRLGCSKKMVVLEGASHMPTEHPGVEQLEAAVLEFFRALPTQRS